MYSVKFSGLLDTEFINTILDIDASVYPKKLQGTYNEIYGRLKANTDTFILLYDDEKIIGYLCLFPIKDILYEKIINEDRIFDSDISGEYLEQYKPFNTYILYILSVVIIPEYQKQGLSKYLKIGFYNYLLNKKKNNIFFSLILSTSVSLAGKRFLERIGLCFKKSLFEGCELHELIINKNYYELIERSYK